MQNSLVSVIIPVYNSEEFIDRCVKSILNQTYKNIEIILVNDGSTDNSLNILKSYCNKYNYNIIVVSQKNMGSGIARKNGLQNSNGEYITFVDSDDELKQNAIEELINDLNKDTDVIISGFYSVNDKTGKKIIHSPKNNSLWTQLKFSCTAFKLYKKSYLQNFIDNFINSRILEDVALNTIVFSNTNNIQIQNKWNYINHIRQGSITKENNLDIIDITDTLNYINNLINANKYPPKTIAYFYMKTCVQNILMQNNSQIGSKIICSLFDKYCNWIKNNYELKVHWEKDEEFIINIIVNLFIIFKKIKLQKLLFALLRFFRVKA